MDLDESAKVHHEGRFFRQVSSDNKTGADRLKNGPSSERFDLNEEEGSELCRAVHSWVGNAAKNENNQEMGVPKHSVCVHVSRSKGFRRSLQVLHKDSVGDVSL